LSPFNALKIDPFGVDGENVEFLKGNIIPFERRFENEVQKNLEM
jgi:hypothetical protein